MEDVNLLVLGALSIVQGVVEWLPVSSEGVSMFLMLNVLKLNPSSAFSYAVFLHTGTMLAVLVKFRREFLEMLQSLYGCTDLKLLKIVVVASLFTAFTALPLLHAVKGFRSGELVNVLIGVMLILTGIVLRLPGKGYRDLEELGMKEAALLGLAQGFAIIPGISRSGTTISFLLLRKLREEHALKLSFIISVPAVIGAAVIEGLPGGVSAVSAAVVVATTFVVGYTTMDLLLRFARRVNFSAFCISLGVLAIVTTLLVMVYV
jgi:undecaprenyl-diphosphatase